MLLQNQDFKVKDTGVDLQRLMEATAFLKLGSVASRDETIDRDIASFQEEIAALDLATATSNPSNVDVAEVVARLGSAPVHLRSLVFSYWMQGAGWTPSYNVRVEDVDDPMRLECRRPCATDHRRAMG